MIDDGLTYTEFHSKGMGLILRLKRCITSFDTKFQRLDLYETLDFGKLLTLDNLVMVTEKDEFIYHEMIAHVPLFSHKNPENVLVIGGGDGGTVREVVKHKTVKNVDMVEIDEDVVKISKKYLPTMSCELDNPKVNLYFQDGVKWVEDKENYYDVIIIDSTDPVSIGEGLFTSEFYRNCLKSLKPGGVLANQTESPFHNPEWVEATYKKLKKVFPIVKMFTAYVPTYPAGVWSFGFCSKDVDPIENFQEGRYKEYNLKLKYYNNDIHKGAFAVPQFVKELINKSEV